MIDVVFIDMDEVLVDFRGGAARIHGLSVDEMFSKYGDHWDGPGFWDKLREVPLFWQSLHPLPWASQLINVVMEVTKEWYILTSPSECYGCESAKKWWMRNYLNSPAFDRIIPTGYKHLLAKPGRLLIDDHPDHVTKFCQHGGTAILFPRSTNCEIVDRLTDPVRYVKETLNRLT